MRLWFWSVWRTFWESTRKWMFSPNYSMSKNAPFKCTNLSGNYMKQSTQLLILSIIMNLKMKVSCNKRRNLFPGTSLSVKKYSKMQHRISRLMYNKLMICRRRSMIVNRNLSRNLGKKSMPWMRFWSKMMKSLEWRFRNITTRCMNSRRLSGSMNWGWIKWGIMRVLLRNWNIKLSDSRSRNIGTRCLLSTFLW